MHRSLRHPPGHPLRRSGRLAACLLTAVALAAVLPGTVELAASPAGPAAGSPAAELPEVPLAERYHETLHGGVARASNSVLTCGDPVAPQAVPCADARQGVNARGRAREYEMGYVDVDSDRNTYNSSSAELVLPPGSRVTYARLYWGANIRVGEQKPPAGNERVLLREPGGAYKWVRADTVTGHRDTAAYEGFSASADVTDLVRTSPAGAYTVAQVNVAMGHSRTGGWGGWTLVAAYENPDEPLREVAIYDGYQPLDALGERATVTLTGLDVRPGAAGRLGIVGYGGDRRDADTATVTAPRGRPHPLGDVASPAADVMNSTIADRGRQVAARDPAHPNTLGYDADVFDITGALRRGAGELELAFAGGRDAYQLGVVFLQAGARTDGRTGRAAGQ